MRIKPIKSLSILSLAAFSALIAVVAAGADAALRVEGYARETLPGASMSVAYLSLYNDGAEVRYLRGVELPGRDGATADLHTTAMDGGVNRMRPLKQLAIPAGGAAAMAPGGRHLMLHGVQLKAGETLLLRLLFANGEAVEVRVPVRRPGNGDHHS